jgi:rhodanese-related sulfurtransferase
MGYTNVKVFAAGYPAWTKSKGSYAAVDVEYVAKQIEGNQAIIVDSRPKRPKYDKGHIPTAMSIPDSRFEALSGKLPRDLNTVLIFYCGGYT